MRAFVPFASVLVLLCMSTLSASADGRTKLCLLDSAKSVSGVPRYTWAMPESTAVPWFVAGDHIIKIQRPGVNLIDWATCQQTPQDIGPTGQLRRNRRHERRRHDRGVLSRSRPQYTRARLHLQRRQRAGRPGHARSVRAASLSSFGLGANADGSVVVGAADIDAQGNPHAFRWTAAKGMVDLCFGEWFCGLVARVRYQR